MKDQILKIGVFYDGNYFSHVSNFYNYEHPKRKRLSFKGLHGFIIHEVSEKTGADRELCRIIESHLFRGRIDAAEASRRGDSLYVDRVIEDAMMGAGIQGHYLPIRFIGGVRQEKGIDVLLALETYEVALRKSFDVVVLVAADGDYVPLLNKLHGLGTMTMLLSWDFEYTSENGQAYSTRTSQELLDSATYYIAMHYEIDNRARRNDATINNIFLSFEKRPEEETQSNFSGYQVGEIFSLKPGYGFIKLPPSNVFFHSSALVGVDMSELRVGDKVRYRRQQNEKGDIIAVQVSLVE